MSDLSKEGSFFNLRRQELAALVASGVLALALAGEAGSAGALREEVQTTPAAEVLPSTAAIMADTDAELVAMDGEIRTLAKEHKGNFSDQEVTYRGAPAELLLATNRYSRDGKTLYNRFASYTRPGQTVPFLSLVLNGSGLPKYKVGGQFREGKLLYVDNPGTPKERYEMDFVSFSASGRATSEHATGIAAGGKPPKQGSIGYQLEKQMLGGLNDFKYLAKADIRAAKKQLPGPTA